MSVDRLQNLMADYQYAHKAEFDIDPSDVYRRVFKKLGWSDEKIDRAIKDCDVPLERALLQDFASANYAVELVRGAILEEIKSLQSTAQESQV